jgi:hypothetical protein
MDKIAKNSAYLLFSGVALGLVPVILWVSEQYRLLGFWDLHWRIALGSILHLIIYFFLAVFCLKLGRFINNDA